jgi:hypothetical protein
MRIQNSIPMGTNAKSDTYVATQLIHAATASPGWSKALSELLQITLTATPRPPGSTFGARLDGSARVTARTR